MVGTVRGQYLLDDLSKDLIGLAATRSHQLRTRSERRVVHHNREPSRAVEVVPSEKLVVRAQAQGGLHSCTTLPVASITTVAEAKPLITAFRIGKEIFVELLRAGIEKAPFPYWRFVLGGQRFLSDKFASALSL